MLNCIAEFTGSDSNKSRCGNGVQRTITSTCQRLTADLYAGIINNYYIGKDQEEALALLLVDAIAAFDADKTLVAVVQVEHQAIFEKHGFTVEKAWKLYVKMRRDE
mgnify:CR=1 FL=1